MATYAKLSSGKWRVQVRRAGIYRNATFRLKRDAQDWATNVEAQISTASGGGLVRPAGSTFADLVRVYLESVPPLGRSKAHSVAKLEARLGRVPLERLGPMHIRDFVDGRVAEGAGGATIAPDLTYLAGILEWAKHVRRLDLDPGMARDARRDLKYRGLDTRSVRRERLPTDEELDALRHHWAGKTRQKIPMALIMDFALASAMRLGEICRIEAEDVDRERRTVTIRDRKDPKKKAGNDQDVPLVGNAWPIVERQLIEHPTGRLFPYSARSISVLFARACRECGIDDLHFHDMRHAATVALFRAGLDIPRVAIVTGHRSWENLKRYTQLEPSDVHQALEDTP